MNTLAGKNILIVGVKFYHYNEEIISKLEKSGANVTFFHERDITIKHAIIDAFFNQYMMAWQEKHYAGILKQIAGKQFDYLLVIRGFMMPLDFVDRVKQLNAGIKTIMYQWDSLHNWDYREKIPLFDRSYTFDYNDAEQLGLKYVPTFHTDEFSNLQPVKIEYDLFFFGNFTRERYDKMQELIAFAQSRGYRLKTHLYMGYKRNL